MESEDVYKGLHIITWKKSLMTHEHRKAVVIGKASEFEEKYDPYNDRLWTVEREDGLRINFHPSNFEPDPDFYPKPFDSGLIDWLEAHGR